MKLPTLTSRTLLRMALATTALAAPFVAYAAGSDAPRGNMVLAWRTNIAPTDSTRNSPTAGRPPIIFSTCTTRQSR
jgi:hypothetical protein